MRKEGVLLPSLSFSRRNSMVRVKSDVRSCKYCSHKKPDIQNLCYYCANRQSEHYLEKIRDDENMKWCKSGNCKKLYK